MELQLWLLRVSAELVAFDLVLVAQERCYYYLSVFRQDHRHAGAYLLARIIETACATEFTCVDLLRGPHAYKHAWADHANTVYEIVCPSTLPGQAAALAYAARWRAAESSFLRGIRSAIWRIGDRR